eukprot:ctg_3449.g425
MCADRQPLSASTAAGATRVECECGDRGTSGATGSVVGKRSAAATRPDAGGVLHVGDRVGVSHAFALHRGAIQVKR